MLIEAGVNTWYVHVPPEARTYRLHIGYRTQKGTFFALAKSNVCSMPVLNANLSPKQNLQRAANGQAGDKPPLKTFVTKGTIRSKIQAVANSSSAAAM